MVDQNPFPNTNIKSEPAPAVKPKKDTVNEELLNSVTDAAK